MEYHAEFSTERESCPMSHASLHALSPVDGRYASHVDALRAHLSEAALIVERIKVEAEWLLHLALERPPGLQAAAQITPGVLERARQLAEQPPSDAPEIVKTIERRTNHDVKAVEYYVRDQLAAAGADAVLATEASDGCCCERAPSQ